MTTISITGDSNDTDLVLGSQSGAITENSNIPSTSTLENKVDELKTLLLSHSSSVIDSLLANEAKVGDEKIITYPLETGNEFIQSSYLNHNINLQAGKDDYYLNSSMWGGKNTQSALHAAYSGIIWNSSLVEQSVYGINATDILRYGGRNAIAYGAENNYSGYVKSRDGSSNLPPNNIPVEVYKTQFNNQDATLMQTKLITEIGKYIKVFSGDIIISRSTTCAMNSFLSAFPFRNNDTFMTTKFHWVNDGDQFDGIQAHYAAYGVTVHLNQNATPEGVQYSKQDYINFYKANIRQELQAGHRPRVLILDHMHWATGVMLPIGQIATALKAYVEELKVDPSYSTILDSNYKLVICMDLAHTMGVQPLDFSPTGTEKDVDVAFAPFHKRMQGENMIAFTYVKNGFKNELGLFMYNDSYFYFPYEFGVDNYFKDNLPVGKQDVLAGTGAYFTDCINLSPSNSGFQSALITKNLQEYAKVGGGIYFKNLAKSKYTRLGSLVYNRFGKNAFVAAMQSPWVTVSGEIANSTGSDLDTDLINDAMNFCPGVITDLSLVLTDGTVLYPGLDISGSAKRFKIGHDSLKSLMFWDRDDPDGNKYSAGDIVCWNHLPGADISSSPYFADESILVPFPIDDSPYMGTYFHASTWTHKVHILQMQNKLNVRNINSKVEPDSHKDVSGIVWQTGFSGNLSSSRRINVNRFTLAQYVSMEEVEIGANIMFNCIDQLVASYNGNKQLFNSLCEAGIYWAKPQLKPNSYRFSWFNRQRLVNDVPNDLTQPVYTQLGEIDGEIDPTGYYRHSGGEDHARSFIQLGLRRYITNTTEWDTSLNTLRLDSFLPPA
jgi:hypothetical protein